MEFEDMKKIWDSQSHDRLYAINEQALHNRVLSKKRSALRIVNTSEVLIIITYLVTGSFVMSTTLTGGLNISLLVLSFWMIAIASYMGIFRIKRMRTNNQFDRTMLGDLSHALSAATYQVKLSRLLRWNILPMAVLILLAFWEGNKSLWIALGTLAFVALAFYFSGWEHSFYERRKKELESLHEKLESEND